MKTKGLTLKEAIESGKEFWQEPDGPIYGPNDRGSKFTWGQVLATWEIKIEPREFDLWINSSNQAVFATPGYNIVPLGCEKIRVREILDDI